MTYLAHNDRLDAIRRAEGQVTAELAPHFRIVERGGVERLEADYLQAPAPKRRTWRVDGPMVAVLVLAASAGVFVLGAWMVAQWAIATIGG